MLHARLGELVSQAFCGRRTRRIIQMNSMISPTVARKIASGCGWDGGGAVSAAVFAAESEARKAKLRHNAFDISKFIRLP